MSEPVDIVAAGREAVERIVRDYGSVEPHIVGDIRGESYIGWRDRVDTWLPLSIRWALLRCDQRRAGQSQ